MQKSKKLSIKDLVTIGVFVVIYFVVMFSVGMMGVVPILYLIYPTVLGIVSGVVVMLFMAKVQKPWALFIFGMISPLIMFAMGHTYILPLCSSIFFIIAELIRRTGGYNSFKANSLSFAIFNMWICNAQLQMLLAREEYINMSQMMGEDYVMALEKLLIPRNIALVYLGAFIGGLIGAQIGRLFLKKHFEKAGIV